MLMQSGFNLNAHRYLYKTYLNQHQQLLFLKEGKNSRVVTGLKLLKVILVMLILQVLLIAACLGQNPKITVLSNDYELGDKTSCLERTFQKEIRVTTGGAAKLYIKAYGVHADYYTPTIKFGDIQLTTLPSPRDLATSNGEGTKEKVYDLGALSANQRYLLTITAQTATGHQCAGLDKSACPDENLDDLTLKNVEIRGVGGTLVNVASGSTCEFSSQCQASPSSAASEFCDSGVGEHTNRCEDKQCRCEDAQYCTERGGLHDCEHFIGKVEGHGCFLGLFGPPNEQFRVGNGPAAFANKYNAEFDVNVIGGPEAAPKLVILIDKTLDSGLNRELDSEFKINNRPAKRFAQYSSLSTEEGKDKFTFNLTASDLKTGKNTLTIDPKGDDFAIYKIWIENVNGARIWKEKNERCSYQSECRFDVIYDPPQLACDFTATPQVCSEKKRSGEPCDKNFECRSGTCTSNQVCT